MKDGTSILKIASLNIQIKYLEKHRDDWKERALKAESRLERLLSKDDSCRLETEIEVVAEAMTRR